MEDVDKWETGCGTDGVLNVSDAEQKGDQNAICERYVEQETPHHTFRHNDAGVFNFFRC